MYVKLKSGRAEGTCIVINLLQKALIAQTITFSHCWPCENLSSQISQLLSSQSYEWDFKLTNLADIFQDETSIAFLHRRQTSAKWEFKLANLAYIFSITTHHEIQQIYWGRKTAINLLQKFLSPPLDIPWDWNYWLLSIFANQWQLIVKEFFFCECDCYRLLIAVGDWYRLNWLICDNDFYRLTTPGIY